MKLQLLSDLHLETEAFDPEPAPGAEVLVLAGDVDSSWAGLERFAGWPVPVVFVPGNHEFDRRDVDAARSELRALCQDLGYILLDDGAIVISDRQGRRVRFVGSTRWSDFDLFGEAGRERAMRAAAYFQQYMAANRDGQAFDAAAVRKLALQCRHWLGEQLALVNQVRAGMPRWSSPTSHPAFAVRIRATASSRARRVFAMTMRP